MADSCMDMNSNCYLRIVISRAPALSTGHNIVSGWQAACHVLKLLYCLWSACSKFIKNRCHAGINIERGCHHLLTTFWKASLGPQPKTLTHELVSQKSPSKFSFQETEDFLNCVCKQVCRIFLKKWEVPIYVRWNIYVAQKQNLWCKNDKRQKWDRNSE